MKYSFYKGARVKKKAEFYGVGKYPRRGAKEGIVVGMSADKRILYVLGDGNAYPRQTPAFHWELVHDKSLDFVSTTMDL